VVLDEAGHRLVGRRDFLAVFEATAEYAVRHNDRLLGSVSARASLRVGSGLVFAGRPRRVVAVHPHAWRVDVEPHTHGLPATFLSNRGSVHRQVLQKMRDIYESSVEPEYL